MKVDYIRRDVPAEISEEGGAFIQLVGKQTIGLFSSIKEAIANLYCVGEASMIEGYFTGIMRSVFEGIREDGHPRSLGDMQFYPVCGGTFDLDKGWDPAVNDVRIKARLLNGVELDISGWTFRDVTPGRVQFKLDKISDGVTDGAVSSNRDVEINGTNIPAKSALGVSWTCNGKSGEVAADKYESNVSRVTIDKSVLNQLTQQDDGKEFACTVKGCYNKATIKALFAYAPPPATITNITNAGGDPDTVIAGLAINVGGNNLTLGAGDKVTFANARTPQPVDLTQYVENGTATGFTINVDGAEAIANYFGDDGETATFTVKGVAHTVSTRIA